MDTLSTDFDYLKLSAFSKYRELTGDIQNVTIGPNSIVLQSPRHDALNEQKTKKDSKVSFKKEDIPSTTSFSINEVLKEFEAQRKEKLQEAMDSHYNKFESFSKTQKETQGNQWLNKQQAFIQSVHESEQMILHSVSQHHIQKTKQNEKIIKDYQDMIQRKMQYEEQLKRNREKQRKLNENIDKIQKYQIEFRLVYQEIFTIIRNCTSGEELKKALGDNFKLLNILPKSFEDVIAKCKNYIVDEEQLEGSANVVLQLKKLKTEIEEAVAKISTAKTEVKVSVAPEISVKENTVNAVKDIKSTASVDQYISVTNLKKYSEVKQFLSQHVELFKELVNDEQLKQFRSDCKKAVNFPVNAISAVSSEHLKDKYVKLHNLLAGKTVSIADKQINASRHSQGVPFCMDLLAKKFVLQGDLAISNNPEAAFFYATIILSLWNDFPNFGKLLLGYFYMQCPYLIPFYIPKTDDLSNENYYLSLGYHYNDGQIEKQDKFLKRMTGILRLYFTMMIAKPKRDQLKHPFDIKNAWTFLVSILKLEPQMDITATSLHIFLETAGFEMETVYGTAFKKLVVIIINKFLPELKKIDSGGPVSRLELHLQDYRRKGHFEKPNGILAANFW